MSLQVNTTRVEPDIVVVLFSGSLYALSLTGARWLGAITPFGGLAFLAGWACLAWAAWKA